MHQPPQNASDQPLVSVITPSFNQGQFIEDCLLSIRDQDYPCIEHLVVDGGSKDNTVTILQQYTSTYTLHWVSEPDQGQVDALNKGFARAQGEILTWLNSDDTYLTSRVVNQVVALFLQYPQVDVVTGCGVMMDVNGKWLRLTGLDPVRISYHSLRYRNAILQPATFFRKSVLKNAPLDPNLHYAFDWDFWIRLARDYNILAVQHVWAGYRWWGENKTASGDSKRTREQAEVLRRHLSGRAWQYWLMLSFYSAYRIAEMLPDGLGKPIKRFVHQFSYLLSELSRKHIPIT